MTLETFAIMSNDLETGRIERLQLPPSESMSLKLNSQHTETKVHLPGQIQESLSGPSTRNPSSMQNNAMELNNGHSNESDVKAEAIERKRILEKCMDWIRIFGIFVGIRMTYDWKPRRYFSFFMTCFVIGFAVFSVLYTVYVHYANGSYLRVLEPLSISGIAVSGFLKVYEVVASWHRILAITFAIRKYFRSDVFGRQAGIIKSSLRKTWIFMIVFVIGNSMCLSIFAIAPITVYINTNELTPLLPIEVFFVDQTQSSGFIVTTIAHLIMGCYASAGAIFYGLIIIFCFRTYILQSDLIAEDFHELDDKWNCIKNISVEYNRAFLKNICKKRQDMSNFLNVLKYVYETQFSIFFGFNYLSQIIFLFIITQNNWIGGYGPCFMSFLEMMFYCYMGTQISIVEDKLCFAIYHSNWYMYDLESQMMVQKLLHDAQQAKDLQLTPIGPLNLVTGIMIVKSIYSYYTVMTELF